MKLKNPDATPPGGFQFFYKNNKGTVLRIQHSSGIAQLTEKVAASMRNNDVPVPEDLKVIVEHQICIRQEAPLEYCTSSGIGDDLHNKWIGPFLKKGVAGLAEAAGLKKVAQVVRRVAGCSSCGGTKVYDSSKSNLGRAGLLNKIRPK